MLKIRLLTLAAAGLVALQSHGATFADAVVSYTSGASAGGYTNSSVLLGAPSLDSAGWPVDPFSPPWQTSQILGVGSGGSVVVKFNTPILNNPANPYGLDFIIFGHAGFNITNWGSANPATDGSLFTENFGVSQVSVSCDGVHFYRLNPALAPTVDKYFPPDATGNFHMPVDPSVTTASMQGATLEQIRALYKGSGGGAGYDISWAQDANGNSVSLPYVSYIRIEETNDVAYIDAISSVDTNLVAVISEDFTTDPASRGWSTFGDASLFRWNATNHNVEATWDSSRPNSYFFKKLDTVLTRNDDFTVSFDLVINDLDAENFELTLGFLNLENATNANFIRDTGLNSPNLFEFDYFPAGTEWPDGVAPSFFSTNSTPKISMDWLNPNMPFGVPVHVIMNYTSADSGFETTISTDQEVLATSKATLGASFTDFRLNAFAIESYHSSGSGSMLAHGTVGNITLVTPPSPVQNARTSFVAGQWQLGFDSRTNWSYFLESTTDLTNWMEASSPVIGTGARSTLVDTNAATTMRFYRVKAQRN